MGNTTVNTSKKSAASSLDDILLQPGLEENIGIMDHLFKNVDILIKRSFKNSNNPSLRFCIYYTDGIVDSMMINDHIIRPLLFNEQMAPGLNLFEQIKDSFVMANDVKESHDMKEIVEAVTYGDTILFIEGFAKVLIISSKNFMLRAISEPEGEKVIVGPRDGFTEGILMNLCMIRRRIRSENLKMVYKTMGRQSSTAVCVCYIEGIVNKEILDELYSRLDKIDMDCILDSNYISEYITEKSAFSYPTAGHTERPDIVTSQLLEGRIAIFVDGTPMVLTVPYLFIESLQINEDYYRDSAYGSFTRLLRILGYVLSVIIPGVYVAVVAYHHEILPISLMINISAERRGVPLPASVECFVMLICFDILREAGIRMPSQVGQALSIVGALVIGQAAVEAKLVAAPMIIVVALTGITALTVPKLFMPGVIGRYFILLLSAMFGLYGTLVGMVIMVTDLLNLKTMGVPYIMFPKNLSKQTIKDSFVRSKIPDMLTRYSPLSNNRVRAKRKNGGEQN